MKLSTRARYGIRALLDIAQHSDKSPVPLKDIARREEVSRDYLERMLLSLKAAGLIRSIRGNRGGFILAKPPSQIKLDEIVQTLEGGITLVECVDKPKFCSWADFCTTRDLWKEMTNAMSQVLRSKTLEDLMEMQRKKEQSKAVK